MEEGKQLPGSIVSRGKTHSAKSSSHANRDFGSLLAKKWVTDRK